MLKLHEVYKRSGPIRGDLGVEVEVEARLRLPEPPVGWQAVAEGSLRNGFEYISTIPVDVNKIDEHVRGLYKTIYDAEEESGKQCSWDSPRASVHVHCNVSLKTPLQLYNIVTGLWLLDTVMMEHCGKHRMGNLFCLPIKDAPFATYHIQQDVVNQRVFNTFQNDNFKYASVNLSSVPRRMSLEFRGMRGSVKPDELIDWCTGLKSIIDNCAQFKNPESLTDFCYNTGGRAFIDRVVGGPLRNCLLNIKDSEKKIKDNIPLASNLGYCVDWDKWQEQLDKAHSSKRKQKARVTNVEPVGPIDEILDEEVVERMPRGQRLNFEMEQRVLRDHREVQARRARPLVWEPFEARPAAEPIAPDEPEGEF